MVKRSKRVQPSTERPFVVAGYLRVSTDEQAESGLGLGAQQEKVKAMCIVKGWDAPAFYIDKGVTGKIDLSQRPEGARLLEDIAAGKIDAVIVAALDRIGRRAIFILNFIDKIKDPVVAGREPVQLVSCKELIDTSTSSGRFMVTILAGLAELERDTISERTIAALEERGRTVGIRAGRPPFGYSYAGKDVVLNEDKTDLVRLIFSLHKQGLSLRKIADRVESEKGVHVGFKTVQEILQNEAAYRGGKRGESAETWPVILENAA